MSKFASERPWAQAFRGPWGSPGLPGPPHAPLGPWGAPRASKIHPRAPGVRPRTPKIHPGTPGVKAPSGLYNCQNGGHSDLEGEKLVYNSSSLVPKVPAKFPKGRGGHTYFIDFFEKIDFLKNRKIVEKSMTPPNFWKL